MSSYRSSFTMFLRCWLRAISSETRCRSTIGLPRFLDLAGPLIISFFLYRQYNLSVLSWPVAGTGLKSLRKLSSGTLGIFAD